MIRGPRGTLLLRPSERQLAWARKRGTGLAKVSLPQRFSEGAGEEALRLGALGELAVFAWLSDATVPFDWLNRDVEDFGKTDFRVIGTAVNVRTSTWTRGALDADAFNCIDRAGVRGESFYVGVERWPDDPTVHLLGGIGWKRFARDSEARADFARRRDPCNVLPAGLLDRPEAWLAKLRSYADESSRKTRPRLDHR